MNARADNEPLPKPRPTCRSCHQPIRWAVSEKTGKRIPLDIDPATDGNIVQTGRTDPATKAPIVRYLHAKADVFTGFPSLALAVGGESAPPERYISHFATCPNADEAPPQVTHQPARSSSSSI